MKKIYFFIFGIVALVIISIIFVSQKNPSPTEKITDDFESFSSTQIQPLAVFKKVSQVQGENFSIEVLLAEVKNPSTKDLQSVRVYRPINTDVIGTVILIPGGVGNGRDFEKESAGHTSEVVTVADAGFVAIVYDPLGRGASKGEINFQGFDDQDGLAQIVRDVQTLSFVDPKNVGLASFSYGVTAAAGVLARYPELGIKFWSDWEGPSSRSYTSVGCKGTLVNDDTPNSGSFSCALDEYWTEREASEFVKTASVAYYWRIQQKKDHVQSTYGHTVEMIENAVGNKNMPWVKLNVGEVNAVYTVDTVPFVKNDVYLIAYVIPHLIEMAGY